MKNKIIYLVSLVVLGIVGLSGCKKDETSAGVTRITYYPTITVLGDPIAVVNKGETYTDAGVYVEQNGEDVSDQAIITSNVNTDAIGVYTVEYKAVNEDGFSASASRNVYVIDPTSFATVYAGESKFGSRHYYDAPVVINDNGDGTYTIDDIAGGFYWHGRYPGLEPAYDFHAEAVIKLETDNTITLLSEGSWYWDPDFPTITDGTYDPGTKTITLDLDFAGTPMYVTLVAISK